MKRTALIITLVLVLVLTACTGKPEPNNGGNDMPGNKRDFPDDIAITAFKMQERSTAMLPYYIVRQEDDGWHWYVTRDEDEPEKGWHCSNVITDETAVQEFSKALIEAGILGWDGYSKSRSLGPGVLDGDSGFHLELGLSDGTKLEAHGYNTYPQDYNEINSIVMKAFEEHTDYSKYYPTEWPEENLERIKIAIGSPYTSPSSRQLKVELTTSWKQWVVCLKDPYGTYVDRETDIYEYGETEDPLPIEEFAGLMKKYNILALNQQTENPETDYTKEYFDIYGFFDGEDEKMIEIRKSLSMEEYDAFIREFVDMAKAYYEKIKK